MNAPPTIPPPHAEVNVETFMRDPGLGAIRLRMVAGASGASRPIRHPRVQKSGLALAGHYFGVVPTRVQVLGETELSYLDALTPEARSTACRGFFSLGLSCVVLTRDREPHKALSTGAEATHTPLLLSAGRTSKAINAIHAVLDHRLAPSAQLPGVLVDVFGVGLLLLGKSGIGKSECAVELVLRGHRLVADDVVRCDWRPPGMVFGAPADLLRHHIEVRGLGVLNIKEMFGVTAVRERKRIDVVVRLEDWNDESSYDRLGIEEHYHTILGTPIRLLTVPVRPGRDMGSIVEMAARNELLRREGKNPAQDFVDRLEGVHRRSVLPDSVPESQAILEPLPASLKIPAPPSSSSISLPEPSKPMLAANESSAWVPAVKSEVPDDG